MEENLQTEQYQDLHEEQLQAVTGGNLRGATYYMNSNIKSSYASTDSWVASAEKVMANTQANNIKNQIINNANTGKTFDVGKEWANRLVR